MVGIGNVFFGVCLIAVVRAFDEPVDILARPAVDPVVRVLDRRRLQALDDEAVTEGRQLFFEFFFGKAPGVRTRTQQQAECEGADVWTA